MNADILKYNFTTVLRKTVRKFVMSDLELVFLLYFCEKNGWNLQHPVLTDFINLKNKKDNHSEYQDTNLIIYFSLIGFFVKSYVGNYAEL